MDAQWRVRARTAANGVDRRARGCRQRQKKSAGAGVVEVGNDECGEVLVGTPARDAAGDDGMIEGSTKGTSSSSAVVGSVSLYLGRRRRISTYVTLRATIQRGEREQ